MYSVRHTALLQFTFLTRCKSNAFSM